MQSGRAPPRGTSAGNTPLRLGLIKHLRNRCSRQDVVELLEQQHRPVVCLRRPSSKSRQQIGLPQQSLQGAVKAPVTVWRHSNAIVTNAFVMKQSIWTPTKKMKKRVNAPCKIGTARGRLVLEISMTMANGSQQLISKRGTAPTPPP